MSVNSSSHEDLFKRVCSYIEDEIPVVTYRTLCRNLDVNAEVAKKLLSQYLIERRKKYNGILSVVYYATGERQPEHSELAAIVLEDDLDEWGKDLCNVRTQVYSVQSMDLENSDPLFTADHPVDFESIKSLRESSLITCNHVRARLPGERCIQAASPEVGPVTAKTLSKIEASQKKMFSEIGSSFHALKVKSIKSSEESGPTVKANAGGIATWVKAGGLDPKKSNSMKQALETKKKCPSPEKRASQNSDSDEDFFAIKKSRKLAAVMDSDTDEDIPSRLPADVRDTISDTNELKTSTQQSGSNYTLLLGVDEKEVERSPSPDEPPIVRRLAKTTRRPVPTKQNATELSDSVSGKKKPSAKSKSSLSWSQTFGRLTSVSESEEESDEEHKRPKKQKKRAVSFDQEDEVPVIASVRTKKAKAQLEESNSGDEENSRRKLMSKKKMIKKTNVYGSDVEGSNDEDLDDGKTEPLKPFLTISEPMSQKRRKQIMRTYTDPEGYMVTEPVWVDASDVEKEPPTLKLEKKSPSEVKDTAKHGKILPVGKTSANKKSSASTGKSKTIQSNIMNFFKKTE